MNCCPRCELERELTRLRRSVLLRAGGYGICRGLIDPDWIEAMRQEALRGVQRHDQLESGNDPEAVRGGTPARSLISVEGGPVQDALIAHPALMAYVSDLVGLPVRPCGQRASYTIYAGPQAHLDIHRDIVGCDLALITCLQDDRPDAAGGALDVWLDDLATPLPQLRAAPEHGRQRLALAPGETLLLHGGLVPHRVPPAGQDRLRVVSLACLEVLA